MALIVSDDEYTYRRLQTFLENGLKTMRFIMPPSAASGYAMVSDAAGVGTWGATLSGPFTFTRGVTIAPTVAETVLTLTPKSGQARVLTSNYTDSAFPLVDGSRTVMWSITPTLSGSSGISSNLSVFRIAPTISGIADDTVSSTLYGLEVSPTVTLDSSGGYFNTAAAALGFILTTSGDTGPSTWLNAFGVNGRVNYDAGSDATAVEGASFRVNVNTSTKSYSHNQIVTTARGLNISGSMFGIIGGSQARVTTWNSLVISGPTQGDAGIGSVLISTWNAINISAYTAANPSTTTRRGINMGNITGATTNWQLAIGTSSSCSPSFHWGNLRIGSGTAPTVALDVTGSAAVSGALQVGTILTLAVASAPGSPANGDVWKDSTMRRGIAYWFGVKESIPGVLFTATANASKTNTNTTETSLIGTGVGTVTLPAFYLVAGRTLRFSIYGTHSTDAGATDITLNFKLGSTTIVTTGAITPANSMNDAFWRATVYLTCRTEGGSGTVMAQGVFEINDDGASSTPRHYWMGRAATSTVTVDTTVSQAVGFTVTFAAADSGDTIDSQGVLLEAMN